MSKNLLTSGAFLKPFLIAWTVWILLHTCLIWWLGYSIPLAIGDSLLYNLPLIGLCFFQLYLMQYYLPRKDKFSYIVVTGILISLVVTYGSNLLITILFNGDDDYVSFVRKSVPVRIGVAFLLSACASMVNILIFTLEDQKSNDKRRYEAEQLSKEAELFNLRSQLQPHFLFNSLNSISALAGGKPEEARKMIQQLSDFFRGTIRKDDATMLTLKEELRHLQLYLDIEKVRFGHRLEATIECSDECGLMKIPPLLLQPVIENAIKFGLYDTVGPVNIIIKACKENNILAVQVENPFDPQTTSPKKGTGFGLNAVQRRLFLLFSRNDLLRTEAKENTFITTIKIPQLT